MEMEFCQPKKKSMKNGKLSTSNELIIPIISYQVAQLRTCNFMFWWGLPSLPTKEKENVVTDMEIVQNYGPS